MHKICTTIAVSRLALVAVAIAGCATKHDTREPFARSAQLPAHGLKSKGGDVSTETLQDRSLQAVVGGASC